MKIIDNEGRIFSKINLLDALLIVLVGLMLIWFGYKMIQRHTTVKEYDQYLLTVKAASLDETIAQSIRKGDILTSPTGAYFGTIVTDPEISPTPVYVTTPEGLVVSRAQPKLKDAVFVLQVRVPKGSPTIRYGNQTFKTGATGFIETARTKYTIIVLSIEPFQEKIETNPPSSDSTEESQP